VISRSEGWETIGDVGIFDNLLSTFYLTLHPAKVAERGLGIGR